MQITPRHKNPNIHLDGNLVSLGMSKNVSKDAVGTNAGTSVNLTPGLTIIM